MNIGLLPSNLILKRKLVRQLLDENRKPSEVARAVHVSLQTVYRWKKMTDSEVTVVKAAGRKPKPVSTEGHRKLQRILDARGEKDLRTLQAEIFENLALTYSLGHISRMITGRELRIPAITKSELRKITEMLGKQPRQISVETPRGMRKLIGYTWTVDAARKAIGHVFKIKLSEPCVERLINGWLFSKPRRFSEA